MTHIGSYKNDKIKIKVWVQISVIIIPLICYTKADLMLFNKFSYMKQKKK